MTCILVIEDDDAVRENISELLTMEGYEVLGALDGRSGVDLAFSRRIDLVICDVTMPGIDGFEVFEVLSAHPDKAAIPFIFLSARASRADIRRGMVLGADDYITKPFTRVELLGAISTRLKKRGFSSDPPPPSRLPQRSSTHLAPAIATDPSMLQLYRQLESTSKSQIAVLLLGETGVGKEILARQLHERSGRSGRFVAVNCAAIAETLLESELFGHEKGAFTGANQARAGLFEHAESGTLFLDEVGELAPSTQVKLLRVLEDKEVTRVGGRTPRRIDVRFVAATNRDLERSIRDGDFRADLYYRLNGMILEVPPLRQRKTEILPLVAHFLAAQSHDCPGQLQLSEAVIQAFLNYSWPGNIRELRNVIERAQLLAPGPTIELEHLPMVLRSERHDDAPESSSLRDQLLEKMQEMERVSIIRALEECAGNQTQAARLLGISRRTLVSRLGTMGLPRPRKRPASSPP